MCHHATTAGEQQTDDIILQVRERKWWRNDLEVSFQLSVSLPRVEV